MPEKKREKFLAWQVQKIREKTIFDFQELPRYCESDVQLLKEGCLKFIEEFEEIAGFNPLIESITIATTSCKNVETLSRKNNLSCFKSLLVTGL